MYIFRNWRAAAAKFADLSPGIVSRSRVNFYEKQIRNFAMAGFTLADSEIEELYSKLAGKFDNEIKTWPYWEHRKSTYPSIKKTTPRNGIYQYGTHTRSESIEEAIDKCAALHQGQRAWLMPLRDDKEYVSFEFDIIVGIRKEIIKTLQEALRNPI